MPVTNHASGGTTITGDAIGGFRARIIAQAIGLYLKTGMQASRMYTPATMRRVAGEYTGKTYARSRKGLEQAYADLEALAQGRTLDELGALERTSNG